MQPISVATDNIIPLELYVTKTVIVRAHMEISLSWFIILEIDMWDLKINSVVELTLYRRVSYRNSASGFRVTNIPLMKASTHAEQCTSIQSLNRLHNIYRPKVAQIHRQCTLPELNTYKIGKCKQ